MKNEIPVNNTALRKNMHLLQYSLETGAIADNSQVYVFPMCDKGSPFSLAAGELRSDEAQGQL